MDANTGKGNSGNFNAGDCNAGNFNAGHRNTGNFNAGNCNAGHRNTGNCNAGNYNTGNCNAGNCNAGSRNTGHRNTGNCNAGNYNTGNCNTGGRNTGNYNSGDYNSGYFCTDTPSPMFFDQPTNLTWDEASELVPYVDLPMSCEWVKDEDMTDKEKLDHPSYKTAGGFLRKIHKSIQEAFPSAWEKMPDKDRQRFLDLPNFDAEKFFKCTGVDVRKPKPEDEITVNGVVYVRKVD